MAKGEAEWYGAVKFIEATGKWHKAVYCLKPDVRHRSTRFLQGTDLYHGKLWGIDGCLLCESRVRLTPTVYANTQVANAVLHPEARMRCEFFREWATVNQESLLIMVGQEREKIKRWREMARRRVQWLTRRINKYLYEDQIVCPFCVQPYYNIEGDEDTISFDVKLKGWDKFVNHVNERHGLVRIVRRGRGKNKSYQIRYNGDEPYSNEMLYKEIEVVDFDDLVIDSEEDDEVVELKKKRKRRIRVAKDIDELSKLL